MSNTELLKDEPLGEKLIKKWFWLYFFTYLAAPAGYLTRVIISNSLSVQQVWVIYSLLWIFSILSMYNGLWLTESLKHFLPKYIAKKNFDKAKTIIFFSATIQLITSTIISIIIYNYSFFIANKYLWSAESVELIKYFIIYFLSINTMQVISSIILSYYDTFSNQITIFIKSILILWFVYYFFANDISSVLNYWIAFIWAQLISSLIAITIYYSKYSIDIASSSIIYNTKFIKKFIKYSLRTFLSMNAWLLLTQIDQQMVILLLWQSDAWIFANYMSLISLSYIFISPIVVILFPMVSKLYSEKNINEISHLQYIFYNFLGFFSLYFMWLLIPLWPQISIILFWVKFLSSWYLMYLGWINLLLQTLIYINYWLLSGLWKAKERGIIIFIAGPLNVFMNYIMIQYLWLYWVVLSTIIWSLFMFLLSSLFISKTFKIRFDKKFIFKNILLISLLWFIILSKLNSFFIIDDSLRLYNLTNLIIITTLYSMIICAVNYSQIPIIYNHLKIILQKK